MHILRLPHQVPSDLKFPRRERWGIGVFWQGAGREHYLTINFSLAAGRLWPILMHDSSYSFTNSVTGSYPSGHMPTLRPFFPIAATTCPPATAAMLEPASPRRCLRRKDSTPDDVQAYANCSEEKERPACSRMLSAAAVRRCSLMRCS